MASSDTEIANLAIAIVGFGNDIEDLDTDTSEEGRSCRRFYDSALGMLVAMHPWSFTTKTASLSLVAEDPTDEWGYSYSLPADCRNVRRAVSIRNLPRDTQIKFRVVGREIYADVDDLQIEYDYINENVGEYSDSFAMALATLLARMIAPRLIGGTDGIAKARELNREFYEYLSLAQSQDGRQDNPDIAPESELVRSRGS